MSPVKKTLKCISEQGILSQIDKLWSTMAGNTKEMPSGDMHSAFFFLFKYIYLTPKKKRRKKVSIVKKKKL